MLHLLGSTKYRFSYNFTGFVCYNFEIKFITTLSLCRFLIADKTLVTLVISSHGLTTATVSSCVHLIPSSNLSLSLKKKKKMHWLPISEHVKYKVACTCFNAINGAGPASLSDHLHVYTLYLTLRSSSDAYMLRIQQYKRKTHGFRTFSCFGSHI